MGALGVEGGWGQPDFGTAIRRQDLVERYARMAAGCTLFVAPGGYGKSMLASQCANAGQFDTVIWVDLGGSSPVLDDVLRAIHRVLTTGGTGEAPALGPNALLDVEGAFGPLCGRSVCLVLDNITRLDDSSVPGAVLRVLKHATSPSSRLLVTAREFPRDGAQGPDVWLVESPELLLSQDESGSLAGLLLGTRNSESRLESLRGISGGQVALFCVAARHLDMLEPGSRGAVPHDLRSYLTTLATSHLDAIGRRVLLVASVLGEGTCQDLLTLADVGRGHDVLETVAECVPLFQLGTSLLGRRFRMHEYAAEVYTSAQWLGSLPEDHESDLNRAFDHLEGSGGLARLFRILHRLCLEDEIEARLDRVGQDLLDQGEVALILEIMDDVAPASLVAIPRLLLVKAMALRAVQRFDEALRLVMVARTACEGRQDQERLRVEAAIAAARIHQDLGRYESMEACLRDVMDSPVLRRDSSLLCMALGCLSVACASTGQVELAVQASTRARELLSDVCVSPKARCATSMNCGLVFGLIFGDYRSTGDFMSAIVSSPSTPPSIATHAQGNLAAVMVETGRLQKALEVAVEAAEQCRRMGLMVFAETFSGTQAGALAGLGRTEQAVKTLACCLDSNAESGDIYNAELERNYLAVMLRACGRYDAALTEAERAYVYLSSGTVFNATWSRVELAASLLGVGDVSAAVDHVNAALPLLERMSAGQHILRSDLVLAEAARLSGDRASVVGHLARDKDYLLSENGNWLTAMYVRAFPGLLGPVAAVVGVKRLPAHMLKMVLPEHARVALPLARDFLDDAEWRRLAVRLLGEEQATAFEASFCGEPLVHVRLFGGLEVVTPEGVVADRAWKKRKSRLLFAMLVARQGRDVPRDVILEHLWPEMDEERARNNFYVIWSAMKRALASGSSPCPYVEHVGGVCRVVRPLVRSDLDDFDEALRSLSEAEGQGDLASALSAVRHLKETYRAELLPSEIYDDWFAPLRERYRVQLGDAMLAAGRMCHAAGDVEQALQTVRAGLEHDPWREDLYQAAMRYQIDTGQRSGAVDLFMTCKSKLADDLGLDPSVETRRLYEEVLAMEDGAKK